MPAATGAMVFKDGVITIDGVQYTNQLRKARLVPAQNIQTYPTLVPDGFGQDPYMLRELGTEADQRTSFRNELLP